MSTHTGIWSLGKQQGGGSNRSDEIFSADSPVNLLVTIKWAGNTDIPADVNVYADGRPLGALSGARQRESARSFFVESARKIVVSLTDESNSTPRVDGEYQITLVAQR